MTTNRIDDIYEIATDAGNRAAERMGELVGEASLQSTTIWMTTPVRFFSEMELDGDYNTITHEVSAGNLTASSVLLFAAEQETEMVDNYNISTGTTEMDATPFAESKLVETGNIISNGLITEWIANADIEDADVGVPTRRQGNSPADLFPDSFGSRDGVSLVIESILETENGETFNHYFIPQTAAVRGVIEEENAEEMFYSTVDAHGLVKRAADDAAQLLNDEFKQTSVTVDDFAVKYTTCGNIVRDGLDGNLSGAGFSITGSTVEGVGYVGFDNDIVHQLGDEYIDRFDITNSEAVTEWVVDEVALALMTHFSDIWADVLGESLTYSPPEHFDINERQIMNAIAGQTGSERVFDITAQITTEHGDACSVHLVLSPEGAAEALGFDTGGNS